VSGQPGTWGGQRRALDGLIATVVDLDSGRTETRHLPGLLGKRRMRNGKRPGADPIHVGLQDLLRLLCAELDSRPGRWRVRTISTPQTILRDLQLREAGGNLTPIAPELGLLGQIGRVDLAERGPR
jgi:hypothetical protein